MTTRTEVDVRLKSPLLVGRYIHILKYKYYQYFNVDRCESVCLSVCNRCDVISAMYTLGTRLHGLL